eukprot:CAMPEP_0182529662 /NCGR_PEP_ID=MMETSP1323-20130603/5351_1 /TAXON_ID=236787 /ORGANISM="Florenciella parvula, Strain RCC1693" /LENGTH=130 /DNA_ID=CAMNT_0024738887 /DNA_START=451 /DNA_END=843 /DNA_ORIENTATION=-
MSIVVLQCQGPKKCFAQNPDDKFPVCGASGLLVNDRGQHMARVRVHAGYHPCDLVPICGHHGPAKATAGAAVVRVQRGPVAFRPYQPSGWSEELRLKRPLGRGRRPGRRTVACTETRDDGERWKDQPLVI